MADKAEASWADTSNCFPSGGESSAQSVPAPTTNRTEPPSSSAKCLMGISRRKDRPPRSKSVNGSLMQRLDSSNKHSAVSTQHSARPCSPQRAQRAQRKDQGFEN